MAPNRRSVMRILAFVIAGLMLTAAAGWAEEGAPQNARAFPTKLRSRGS
jgi:hypothetical protein